MHTNDIDKFFKDEFSQYSDIQSFTTWDKTLAWANLQKKRRTKRLKYSAVAAVILAVLSLGIVSKVQFDFLGQPSVNAENSYEEHLKRQKLHRLERKISGLPPATDYCMFCGDEFFVPKTTSNPFEFNQ